MRFRHVALTVLTPWSADIHLAAIGLVAVGTLVHAQVVPRPPATPTDSPVFSGAEIGFQAVDTGGKTVIGKLVVRVNGQWKEAQFAPGMRLQPLSSQ